ncbi:MAG TPA: urea amidolyase associated protein UAAP2 [Tepidisphaeraceae bacterium]|jgi:hypothetical protein
MTIYDDIIPARAPWAYVVRAGQSLRVIDVEGNQAVDFLVFNAHDHAERYSAQDTMAAQKNIFLVTGSRLLSGDGNVLMTVADTNVKYHDTIGGACSPESNTLRYGHHTKHQHACVDNFLIAGAPHGLGKRDLTSNINLFMNVPVEPDGSLGIVDGISGPGMYVDLVAAMDVLVVISNCPQINNPCNAFNPTPVRVVISGPLSGVLTGEG